jgi:hypothetical protein
MMLALSLAAMAQSAAAPPPARAVTAPSVQAAAPTDWSTLPMLPYLRPPVVTASMTSFVSSEIASKRCAAPRAADGTFVVRLDLAVFVDEAGGISRVVPRAINCPTVEQYGAGLVTGFARDNLPPHIGAAAGWYRTTLAFDWPG